MKWTTLNRIDRLETSYTVFGSKPAGAGLLERLGRQMFRHVLPIMLMLLVTGWLTLKVGIYIEQAKQPPTYATLSER